MGGYTSKEISGSPHSGTIYDDSSIVNFDLPGGEPNVFGRCFIEVKSSFMTVQEIRKKRDMELTSLIP